MGSASSTTAVRARCVSSSPTRGANRAAVAVGHSQLVIVYHVLRDDQPFEDLGANYFDERDREQVRRRLTRRLQALGFEVTAALPA